MLKYIRKLALAAAMVVMLVGCKDCSEDPDAAYQPCKDGEQLDVKTPEELMAMLKSSKWRAVAQYVNTAARNPPGGNPLVVLEGMPHKTILSFEKDSVLTYFSYTIDSLGKEKLQYSLDSKYIVTLSPQGRLSAHTILESKHPNGTPRISYIYYYFCNANKLIVDYTYLPVESQFIYYNICTRD
ncbi:MAG: hypothetical protein EAZ57_10780 [Cytophagales bacterium]|nr:MAG: hypothetical protein EAZ67_11380 [Cytophagales bacterium]TAF59559.1 MAG: hypothetical protein EAZ57_10780 [Cytophagales bacterium]